MTEKGIGVINLIKQYKIYYDFSASDISQVACEKIYPATLTSLVKEGVLKKVATNPCRYRFTPQDKEEKNEELTFYTWEPLKEDENKNIIKSNNFDIPIEIASNGSMKFKTMQKIIVGKQIDFFDERINNEEERYYLWNIMNYREDLQFIIYTFNKNYKTLLPDNWNNGYKNVEIKLLKTIDDINIVPESKIMSLDTYELQLLWNYCIKLLKEWKDNELVLNHNECFLVGYCYLLLDKAKLLNIDIGTEKEIKDAISIRFDVKDTNRILVIGKDISKRGIPIYKDLK